MIGKNLWRLGKTYGRLIGYPMLKPHDLEAVRALLGHKRLDTTQLYAQIRPAEVKHAMEFYEAKALDVLSS